MKVDTGNGKYRIMAEINMIPFIDVALVLLIIFMVMTPFLIRSQIKVNLPQAATAQTEAYDKEALRVQVEKRGDIRIDGLLVPAEKVEATLRGRLHDPARQPLVIEADRDVPFKSVVVVLDAGRKVGAAKLGICVKPESER
jgi:biopolymer transport protein TolR